MLQLLGFDTLAMAVLAAVPVSGETRVFECADGRHFSVTLTARQARVRVANKSYVLARRPASIGIRFVGGALAFAQDGAAGFLVGAPGGPYRRCTLLPADRARAFLPGAGMSSISVYSTPRYAAV